MAEPPYLVRTRKVSVTGPGRLRMVREKNGVPRVARLVKMTKAPLKILTTRWGAKVEDDGFDSFTRFKMRITAHSRHR